MLVVENILGFQLTVVDFILYKQATFSLVNCERLNDPVQRGSTKNTLRVAGSCCILQAPFRFSQSFTVGLKIRVRRLSLECF